MLDRESFKRTVVVGTSGSGKSTFARRLANILDIDHLELDSIFWNPGWRPVSDEVFRGRVLGLIAKESWVIDGNYAVVRKDVWARATTVIWLDLPFRVIFLRLLSRTFRRSVTGESCCNGNPESLFTALFSRDSVLLWAITSHNQYAKVYTKLFAVHPEIHKCRLTTSTAVKALLSTVQNAA
jgi:adenylate kinase family enzyme